ncbi:hypothetical protein GF1_01720 [Desulfolithobacter dissulfuricans]|uniref:Cyclic nucleotide-binding domain-containing protein n=1 Tax=Desulfolithobacter dissulfuricans TaxID=2795293 RepID=A0A915XK55_9BACT|nr:cyclic nucleotide-binding domain-containing protein [Desulfolithobacter dissulfuricans]BCO07796.1 hypothetical protein GF1_01720 [Desulfolithobacter dissulfuricans]
MNSPEETKSQHIFSQDHIEQALLFLRRLPVFAETPLDILRLYAYLAQKEHYHKGDIILRHATPCDRMFLIVSGQVAICHHRENKLFLFQELKGEELNYFGELSLVSKFNSPFCAVARSETVLYSLTREAFRRVMERYPERYISAVEKIVELRIQRFVAQTNFLLDRLSEEALEAITLTEADFM